MKLNNESPINMIESEIKLSIQEEDGLVEYARTRILDDKDELINWAMNDILKNLLLGVDNSIKRFDDLLKEKLEFKKKQMKG